MSKPDWTALADRYGAQPAEYNAGEDDDDWECEFCGRAPSDCKCADGEELQRRSDAHNDAVDLLTLARAHQDAGAAQDGQASIALALGAWLALVVAFAALALCVYGAAWIDGAWLAPFAGLAR